MKRIIILILIIVLLLLNGCQGIQIAQAYSVSSYTYNDLDSLAELIEEQKIKMDAAHQMAEAARILEFSEDHNIIQLAQQEWNNANKIKTEYETIYNDLISHWEAKEQEYPEATFIWSYFKDLGYSDIICAGILGNIMTECGGNTLAIQPTIYGKGHYGMCQWSKIYSPEVWGASLEEQCNYLEETIQEEIDMFGKVYKRGFNYEQFMSLTNIKNAALAFAKCYERCGSRGYRARQNNAIIAYNYFIS